MILAIDLGGTNMRAALVDADGTVAEREERPTPKEPDVDALLELAHAVRARGDAERAVVGVPGRVDYGSGALEYAPNLPDSWRDDLTEAWFGAGRAFSDVAYLTISTGIGAGVVNGGLLVHGRRSVAEVGHTIVDGRAMLEGRPATVEDLGSGTALTELARAAEIAEDGKKLVELVETGDVTATRVLERVVFSAAIGAVNLAHLFTPEVIVVGGGLGLVGELVLGPIRRMVSERGPSALPTPIEVVNAALGDDAGLAGAGAWERAFTPQAAGRVARL